MGSVQMALLVVAIQIVLSVVIARAEAKREVQEALGSSVEIDDSQISEAVSRYNSKKRR